MRYTAVTHIPSIAIKQGVVPEGAQITIAIPTYKRAHLLRETLESCLAQQTNSPFAIMVVDNNPERECETEQLLREYKAIPNLFYYKNTENVGMTGNWNKLFELSQTNFVVMLHDDDLLYEDHIERINFILKKNNYDINALYPEAQLFYENQPITARPTKKTCILRLKPLDFQFGNNVNIAGALFRKKAVVMLDGFNDYFYPPFDYEFNIRMAATKNAFKLFSYPTVLYRISINESIKITTILKMIEKDKEIMRYLIKKYPIIYKYLFKFYFRAYDKNYIQWNIATYNSTTNELKDYLSKKEKETTLFDDLIFKLLIIIKVRFLPLFRKQSIT